MGLCKITHTQVGLIEPAAKDEIPFWATAC